MNSLFGFSRREKYFATNLLSCVPIILIRKSILVDLRNDTTVAGRLISADGFMNLTMEFCVFIDQKGLQYEFDNFMVPARNIRQIIIPDNIKMSIELNDYFTKLATKKHLKPKRGRTFKEARAIRKHQETLKEISEKKE